MLLHEKIQLLRSLRGWSQEDVAEKLAMSVSGYAKIERGETDIAVSRLEQIAQVLGLGLQELFSPQGKVVINLGENNSYGQFNEYTNSQHLAHDPEKMQWMLEQKDKEIELLREQITQLKMLVEALRGQQTIVNE